MLFLPLPISLYPEDMHLFHTEICPCGLLLKEAKPAKLHIVHNQQTRTCQLFQINILKGFCFFFSSGPLLHQKSAHKTTTVIGCLCFHSIQLSYFGTGVQENVRAHFIRVQNIWFSYINHTLLKKQSRSIFCRSFLAGKYNTIMYFV